MTSGGNQEAIRGPYARRFKKALRIMRESSGDGPARQGAGLLSPSCAAAGRGKHPVLERARGFKSPSPRPCSRDSRQPSITIADTACMDRQEWRAWVDGSRTPREPTTFCTLTDLVGIGMVTKEIVSDRQRPAAALSPKTSRKHHVL